MPRSAAIVAPEGLPLPKVRVRMILLDMPTHAGRPVAHGDRCELVVHGLRTDASVRRDKQGRFPLKYRLRRWMGTMPLLRHLVNAPDEIRVCVKVNQVRYLQPYQDWSPGPSVPLYPETPGDYSVAAHWRRPTGASGSVDRQFTVGAPMTYWPELFEMDRQTKFWLPSRWELVYCSQYEKAAVGLLPQLVKPGSVVYDIGANVGMYSVPLARLAGNAGHVYCIEANPVCVYFLRANLQMNGLANAEVVPVAVLDGEKTCEFVINYDSSSLGLTDVSSFWGKPGHRVTVPADSVDNLVAKHHLREPDFIKLDVEGAETVAVRGMLKTLERKRPTLLIELHGPDAARETLPLLDRLGYRYQETQSSRRFESSQQFVAWMPAYSIKQVIAAAA